MQKIPISEIFSSLQGEGVRLGIPSVFIRFWGCNLSCEFCDSEFSWNAKKGKPHHTTQDEVIKKIKSFGVKNLIFTGGEPMLHQKHIRDICSAISPDFVEVETNGTQISRIDDIVDQFNVSPKFDFSMPVLLQPNEKTYWKFIIRDKKDSLQAINYCNEHMIEKENILFQPEGKTREEILATMDVVMSEAMKHNVRISPRLHILLWNDKRAV